MRTRLKLFIEDDQQQDSSTESTTELPLEEFARVIADAVTWDRTWLQDFADEPIHVSRDLYEIIRLYDETHRERA